MTRVDILWDEYGGQLRKSIGIAIRKSMCIIHQQVHCVEIIIDPFRLGSGVKDRSPFSSVNYATLSRASLSIAHTSVFANLCSS